jgi:hypothetical protein
MGAHEVHPTRQQWRSETEQQHRRLHGLTRCGSSPRTLEPNLDPLVLVQRRSVQTRALSRGVADEVFSTPNVAHLDHHVGVNVEPALGDDPPPMPGRGALCLARNPLLGLSKSSEFFQGRAVGALLVPPLPPQPGTRPHRPFNDLSGDLLELTATQVARVHAARDFILSGDPHPLRNHHVNVDEQPDVAREGLEERDEARPAVGRTWRRRGGDACLCPVRTVKTGDADRGVGVRGDGVVCRRGGGGGVRAAQTLAVSLP